MGIIFLLLSLSELYPVHSISTFHSKSLFTSYFLSRSISLFPLTMRIAQGKLPNMTLYARHKPSYPGWIWKASKNKRVLESSKRIRDTSHFHCWKFSKTTNLYSQKYMWRIMPDICLLLQSSMYSFSLIYLAVFAIVSSTLCLL